MIQDGKYTGVVDAIEGGIGRVFLEQEGKDVAATSMNAARRPGEAPHQDTILTETVADGEVPEIAYDRTRPNRGLGPPRVGSTGSRNAYRLRIMGTGNDDPVPNREIAPHSSGATRRPRCRNRRRGPGRASGARSPFHRTVGPCTPPRFRRPLSQMWPGPGKDKLADYLHRTSWWEIERPEVESLLRRITGRFEQQQSRASAD